MIRTTLAIALLLAAVAPLSAQSAPAAPQGSNSTYLEFQVETPAQVRRATSPVYPANLLRNRVEGEVIVQFVVTETGAPDMASFRVIRSSNNEFTEAVRVAVQGTRFSPAKLNGASVRQVVQQPFQFKPR